MASCRSPSRRQASAAEGSRASRASTRRSRGFQVTTGGLQPCGVDFGPHVAGYGLERLLERGTRFGGFVESGVGACQQHQQIRLRLGLGQLGAGVAFDELARLAGVEQRARVHRRQLGLRVADGSGLVELDQRGTGLLASSSRRPSRKRASAEAPSFCRAFFRWICAALASPAASDSLALPISSGALPPPQAERPRASRPAAARVVRRVVFTEVLGRLAGVAPGVI